MTLPEKLMQLRGEQNLSQTALAEALGVSRQTVSKWEAGIAVPTTDNLLRLSKLYGTDLWTLTGVGGRPEGEPSEEKVDEPPAEPKPAEEPADGLPALPEGTADQAPGRADQAPKRRRVHPAALAAGLCAAFLAAGLLAATVFEPKEENVIPIEDLHQEPVELPMQSQFTILEE